MRKALFALVFLVLFAAAMIAFTAEGDALVTCYNTGERISGSNKLCYYDCAGSQAAITVQSHQLCPLTINR